MTLRIFTVFFSILLLICGIGIFLLLTEMNIIPEFTFTTSSSTEMDSSLADTSVDDNILGESYVQTPNDETVHEEGFTSEVYIDEPNEEEPVVFSFENGRRGLRTLRAELENYVSPLGGDYSIYVKNLDTNEYLLINNQRQTAASLIKLFNFAYAFFLIENGTLESTSSLETWLTNSIVISCNNSYNYILRTIGSGNVLDGARQTTDFFYDLGFYETTVGGTLHPSDFEEQHFAGLFSSVRDVGHLLEKIYRGTFGSESTSEAMLDILLAQRRVRKIPAGLPEGTVVANKTGERSQIQHDSAIVFSENANYIIVIMTENAPSAIGNIQHISRMVYEYFNPADEEVE